MAALTNARRSLELLVERGCNVMVKSIYGWTPLHASLRFGSMETLKVLLRTDVVLEEKDVNGFEAVDYVLIYNQVKVLESIYENYPSMLEYLRKHLITLKVLEICIDNNSAEVMELLVKKYREEYIELVEKHCEGLAFRCIAFNSLKTLQILEGICKHKVSANELELAVYYSDEELFKHLVDKYYKESERKIQERALKVSIHMKKIDYAFYMLKHSKECRCEHVEEVINSDAFDWSIKNLGRVNNIRMIKKRMPSLADRKVKEYSELYSASSIVHMAIESGSQELALKVLETDASLKTKRKTDNATPLIAATKVPARHKA